MGTMRIMGGLKLEELMPDLIGSLPPGMLDGGSAVEKAERKGDMPVVWDANNPTEVRYAREIFDHAKKKGFRPALKGGRGPGKFIDQFDPSAGELIFVAPMRGGQ